MPVLNLLASVSSRLNRLGDRPRSPRLVERELPVGRAHHRVRLHAEKLPVGGVDPRFHGLRCEHLRRAYALCERTRVLDGLYVALADELGCSRHHRSATDNGHRALRRSDPVVVKAGAIPVRNTPLPVLVVHSETTSIRTWTWAAKAEMSATSEVSTSTTALATSAATRSTATATVVSGP